MDYLWCPADWTKGAQTKAAVRLERVKERGVIRLEARDLHLRSALCLSGLLLSHTAGEHTLSSGAALHLRSQTSTAEMVKNVKRGSGGSGAVSEFCV